MGAPARFKNCRHEVAQFDHGVNGAAAPALPGGRRCDNQGDPRRTVVRQHLAEQVVIAQQFPVIAREDEQGVGPLLVLVQVFHQPPELMVDVRDLRIVRRPRPMQLPLAHETDGPVDACLPGLLVRPVAHRHRRELLVDVLVEEDLRRIQRRMRPVVRQVEEERPGRIAPAQEVDSHRRDVRGGVNLFAVRPWPRYPRVAVHAVQQACPRRYRASSAARACSHRPGRSCQPLSARCAGSRRAGRRCGTPSGCGEDIRASSRRPGCGNPPPPPSPASVRA